MMRVETASKAAKRFPQVTAFALAAVTILAATALPARAAPRHRHHDQEPAAPQTDPAQCEALKEPSDLGAVDRRMSCLRDTAANVRAAVTAQSKDLEATLVKHKTEAAAAKAGAADFGKQQQAAVRASKACQSALKKDAAAPKTAEACESARAACNTFVSQGESHLQHMTQLAQLDEAVTSSLAHLDGLARAAKIASGDAQEALAAAKRVGAGQKGAAASELAKLKPLADDTKTSELAAAKDLARLKTQAGVRSAASAAEAKEAADKTLVKLQAQLSEARTSLSTLPTGNAPAVAAGAAPAPSGPSAVACDIRKTEWAKFQYPNGGPDLSKGSTEQQQMDETGEAVSFGGVEYRDTDKNGQAEAYVTLHKTTGTVGGDMTQVFVFEMDRECKLQCLGATEEGWLASMSFSGPALVLDAQFAKDGEPLCCPTGKLRYRYQVKNGKLEPLKKSK